MDARLNIYVPENGEKNADDYVVTTGTSREHTGYWAAPEAQGHVVSQYGYEIIDKWVDYCMIEDDTLAATATAEWLMDIAGQAPA